MFWSHLLQWEGSCLFIVEFSEVNQELGCINDDLDPYPNLAPESAGGGKGIRIEGSLENDQS